MRITVTLPPIEITVDAEEYCKAAGLTYYTEPDAEDILQDVTSRAWNRLDQLIPDLTSPAVRRVTYAEKD